MGLYRGFNMELWVSDKISRLKDIKTTKELMLRNRLDEVKLLRSEIERLNKEIGTCFAIGKKVDNSKALTTKTGI